ncbi:MAG: hypothetical protein A2X36_14710 [Elusimicrobia bacterium GWA2_69_24]|nr:MAG: hypothetical protein A2X36_14710 [Elusimicrobia bacterium GWA2_69_24]HBL17634.1 hypothetical protein [Elusimicrobiota bacterium]
MRRPQILLLAGLAAGLFIYHALLVRQWVREDRQPPGWDPAVHLGTALDYRDAWREGDLLRLLLTKSRPGHPPYPPVYHYSLIPLLESPHPQTVVAVLNLGYFMILLLASGWAAFRLGGPWAAAATLLACGLSPGLLLKFREAFPDLSIAAWVTLTYALLLESGFYERRRESVLLGLAAALAMNSKWGAVLYLVPAWLAGLGSPVRRRNLWLATAIVAASCLPWYLVNGVQMLPRIWASVILGHHQGQPLTWTWGNWWYYPDFLVMCYSWPGFLLFSAGALRALYRDRTGPRRALTLCAAAWLAFSYLVCTVVPSKDWRYILPAAGALPALGAAGLPAPALGAAVLIALWHRGATLRPEPGDWHMEDVLKTVESRRDPSRPVSTLCVLPNHREVNSTSLGFMARHAGLSRVSMGCEQNEIPEWADFVLLKTGDLGAFFADNTRRITAEAQTDKGLFARAFRASARWPLPDGSEAVLFEARRDLPRLRGERTFPTLQVRSAALEGVRIVPQGADAYEIRVATLTLAKLPAPVKDLRLVLSGARLLEDGGRIYVLGVGTVTLASGGFSWRDLAEALSGRSRLPVTVSAADGRVSVGARLGPLPADLAFRVGGLDGQLELRVERIALAGLGLPKPGPRSWDLGPRPPNQPYAIVLRPVHADERGLWIGEDSETGRWRSRL